MLKTTFVAGLLLHFSINIFSQGKICEELSVESKLLGRNIEYAIYFPPDYEQSDRTYPVLYLLHGGGDDHKAWVQSGEVGFIATNAIQSGKATPMVIVMPNSKPGKSRYFNGYKDEWPYEDFFFQEFIPFIESNYRVKSDKRYRAISGLSMGGRSSFVYALHRPDMFSACCPMSPGAGALEPSKARDFYGPRGFEQAGEKELLEYDDNHSLLRLIERMPKEDIGKVLIYLDCGDDDGLSIENALVHIALKQKGIKHEFRIRDGNHNWSYWRGGLEYVLEFITQGFHK